MTATAVSGAQLARLSDFVTRTFGLSFPPSRWYDLQRGLERIAQESGFGSACECCEWYLSGRPGRAAIEMLAVHLTTNETYFFRDPALFRLLETRLLRNLIDERRSAGRRLRIWSAACSSGEEPYSVAILLHRLLRDIDQWTIHLLATDINVRALKKARAGIYGTWSFRDGQDWADRRFFTSKGSKYHVVNPSLRSFVQFGELNLLNGAYPSRANDTGAMDVIICRNALMYMTPEAARRVLTGLAASLAPNGWLIVAPSELCLVPRDLLAPVYFGDTVLFQKQAGLEIAAEAFRAPVGRTSAELPKSPSHCTVSLPAGRKQPQHSEILRAPEAAREEFPDNAEAVRLLAHVHANEGRHDEALAWCDKAIAADRAHASAYYLRALVLQEQGQLDAARVALEKTLYLDPDFIIGHFSLGALAQARGRANESRRHWRNTAALLAKCDADDIVPESGGMTAARLVAVVQSLQQPGRAS